MDTNPPRSATLPACNGLSPGAGSCSRRCRAPPSPDSSGYTRTLPSGFRCLANDGQRIRPAREGPATCAEMKSRCLSEHVSELPGIRALGLLDQHVEVVRHEADAITSTSQPVAVSRSCTRSLAGREISAVQLPFERAHREENAVSTDVAFVGETRRASMTHAPCGARVDPARLKPSRYDPPAIP